MAPGAHPVAEPRVTQSLVPVAAFRTSQRKKKTPVMGRPFEEEEMKEHVCHHFEQACLDALKEQIQAKAIKPVTKKLKSSQGRISAMEEKRDITLHNLLALQRVPRNIFTTAHQRFIADHDLGATYDIRKFHSDVPNYVGQPLLYWRSIVEKEFDHIWSAEIASASSAGPASATGSVSAGSSSSVDASRSEEASSAVGPSGEAVSDPPKRDLRTCLFGRLNVLIGLPEPSTVTFDIRRALPSGFVFRAEINPLVQVAELPELLQGALERGLKDKTSEQLADLTKIFSPQCISYLYAAFFGVGGSNADSQHPLWDRVVELILELSEVPPLSPSRLRQDSQAPSRNI
ncbi:hypothetical protein EC968_000800 [Mortierella alpina]|nr:hypothetical protein EC968_000800 [Mortierella alpina]